LNHRSQTGQAFNGPSQRFRPRSTNADRPQPQSARQFLPPACLRLWPPPAPTRGHPQPEPPHWQPVAPWLSPPAYAVRLSAYRRSPRTVAVPHLLRLPLPMMAPSPTRTARAASPTSLWRKRHADGLSPCAAASPSRLRMEPARGWSSTSTAIPPIIVLAEGCRCHRTPHKSHRLRRHSNS
jgi:hypothetical protein